MDWKEIGIEHKPLYDRFFKVDECEVSDLTFTNLFIWRHSREIHSVVLDDVLCIRIKYPEKSPLLLMPCVHGNIKKALEKTIGEFQECNTPFRMRAVSVDMVESLKAIFPNKFLFNPEPDRFDYVYSVRELIDLEGTKFKPKRNHINGFVEAYSWTYHPLDETLLDAVAEGEIEWCKKRDCESVADLESEKKGILEALENFPDLKFKGCVIRIDGKIVAFTFGEAITDDMAVIHVEKADPDIRGAYQMINRQFLMNEFSSMTWVNREEDLGIDGLRKAKLSYNPVRMVEKFTAEWKG
jgi:hypothetical protein